MNNRKPDNKKPGCPCCKCRRCLNLYQNLNPGTHNLQSSNPRSSNYASCGYERHSMVRNQQLQHSSIPSTSHRQPESSPTNNSVLCLEVPLNHSNTLLVPFNGRMNRPFSVAMGPSPFGSMYPPVARHPLAGNPMRNPNPQEFLNLVADGGRDLGMLSGPYFVRPHLAPFPLSSSPEFESEIFCR